MERQGWRHVGRRVGVLASGGRRRNGTNRTGASEPHHVVADRLHSCGSIKPPPMPADRRRESEERTGGHNVSLVFCCRGVRQKWVCVCSIKSVHYVLSTVTRSLHTDSRNTTNSVVSAGKQRRLTPPYASSLTYSSSAVSRVCKLNVTSTETCHLPTACHR